MFRRKREERESIQAELDIQNIKYQPMVWTHFGRPHPAAVSVISNLARLVARNRGGIKASVIENKILAAVSVCIARRAARMSVACWPQAAKEGTAERAAIATMGNFD